MGCRINSSLLSDTCRLHNEVANLTREARYQAESNKQLQQKHDELAADIERRKKKAATGNRRLKEMVKRKTKQALQWRQHYKRLAAQGRLIQKGNQTMDKLRKENADLQKQLQVERRQAKQAQCKYEQDIAAKSRMTEVLLSEKSSMVKEIRTLKEALAEMDNQKAELEEKVSNSSQHAVPDSPVVLTKFDKKTFSEPMSWC